MTDKTACIWAHSSFTFTAACRNCRWSVNWVGTWESLKVKSWYVQNPAGFATSRRRSLRFLVGQTIKTAVACQLADTANGNGVIRCDCRNRLYTVC